MKLVAALVASMFAVSAFAADAPKKDVKDGAKPAAAAPAKDAKTAPKSDAKPADKKAEAAKK